MLMESFSMMIKTIFFAVGDAAVVLSQWCAIQAFVQATMWHNTEPKTLGISIWATSLFASACFHGIFCSFIYTVCKMMKIPKSRMDVLFPWISFCGRITPAVLLAISSTHFMDSRPAGRTVLLYCAVFATQLHIFVRLQASDRQTKGQIAAKYERCHEKRAFFSLNSSHTIGCDVIFGALLTMGLRWCCWGVNVLYEYWKMSFVSAAIVLLHSLILALTDPESSWKFTFLSKFLSTLKKSRCEAYQSTEVKNGVNHALKETRDDASSNGSSASFLDKDRHGSTHFHTKDESADLKNLPVTLDLKTDVAISVGDNGQSCSKNSCLDGFFCYAIVAPALGSLGYLFLWIFTSPIILRLWGQFSNDWFAYVVFISFAIGCCCSVMVNMQTLTRAYCANNNNHAQKRISKSHRCLLMGSIFSLMLAGSSLVLFTKEIPFCIGFGLLSFASPVLLRILLAMTYELLAYDAHHDISTKISNSWRVSGFLLVVAAWFSIHHASAVMFITPRVITLFHGNMTFVLYMLVIMSTLPVIVNPFLYMTFDSSSSASTTVRLLESPQSENSFMLGELKPSPSKHFKTSTRTKRSFLFLILTFSVVISVTMSVSFRPAVNCRVSRNMTSKNQSQNHIRVISWNVLLGHTYTGRDNLVAVANVTNVYDPDFMALQEATGHAPYWGGKDIFGFLEAKTRSCRRSGERVGPLEGSLEVGILSKLPISASNAAILPNLGVKELPTYTMAKITSIIPGKRNETDRAGSSTASKKIHIYTVHAVYKNWTCERQTRLSCKQMNVLQDDIRRIPMDEPVILMGDFNVNPSEPELDMWFWGDLKFKSALWPSPRPARKFFNYSCVDEPQWDDDKCDCECRNGSSDPPETTLLNRQAAVDHIFYRGLKFNEAKILNDVGDVSDHYPIMADFTLNS